MRELKLLKKWNENEQTHSEKGEVWVLGRHAYTHINEIGRYLTDERGVQKPG